MKQYFMVTFRIWTAEHGSVGASRTLCRYFVMCSLWNSCREFGGLLHCLLHRILPRVLSKNSGHSDNWNTSSALKYQRCPTRQTAACCWIVELVCRDSCPFITICKNHKGCCLYYIYDKIATIRTENKNNTKPLFHLEFLIITCWRNSSSLPYIKLQFSHPTVVLPHISFAVIRRADATEGKIIGGELSEMYN